MGVMIGCGVLLALGLAGAWRWRNVPFAVPDLHADLTAGEISRRYLWYVSIIITGGVAAGVAVIGAGGRLAMRLLAVTGGEAAPGRRTEGGEIVGRNTVGGTSSFGDLNGVFGGSLFGGLYQFVRRFLSAGPLGGGASWPGL